MQPYKIKNLKLLLFKTNIDMLTDHEKIGGVLDLELKIIKWTLLQEPEFTVLSVLCSGLTKDSIETIVASHGFECEFWEG
jgi:hypothetical protein